MAGPAFATIPRAAIAQVSVANPNRDGTGTIVTVLTAGAQGTKIERVKIKALVTTTAGTIRLFLHDGANARLLVERAVLANVVSASNPAFEDDVDFSTPDQLLLLPAGWSLRAATEKAELMNVIAMGADYP